METRVAGANSAAVASEGADVVAGVKGKDLAVDIAVAHGLAAAFIVCYVRAHRVTVAPTNVEAVDAGCKKHVVWFFYCKMDTMLNRTRWRSCSRHRRRCWADSRATCAGGASAKACAATHYATYPIC